jgi:hypothetical protein
VVCLTPASLANNSQNCTCPFGRNLNRSREPLCVFSLKPLRLRRKLECARVCCCHSGGAATTPATLVVVGDSMRAKGVDDASVECDRGGDDDVADARARRGEGDGDEKVENDDDCSDEAASAPRSGATTRSDGVVCVAVAAARRAMCDSISTGCAVANAFDVQFC